MTISSRTARRDARIRSIRRTSRPRLEQLEARLVLSAFTVVNTGDNGGVDPAPFEGTGTLRQAIIDANANPGADVIAFNIPGPGVHTIAPLTPLPAVSAATIDGTTQPGFVAGGPRLIELSGVNFGYPVYSGNPQDDSGLRIRSDCTVRGLAINGFYDGILAVSGGTNNRIQGNYIGTDPTGSQPRPNSDGVYLDGFANLVGTDGDGMNDEAERNVISGNEHAGVSMVDALNVVAGNYVGTDATGTYAISPPGEPFVSIGINFGSGARGGRIVGNVISGNDYGLYPTGGGVTVQGNLIGTDRTGNAAVPNEVGIFRQYGSEPMLIGGPTPEARNVIAGNDVGISIQADGLIVQGNYIGRTLSGADLGNSRGIYQAGGSSLIGGRMPGEGNVISGNSYGIALQGLSGGGMARVEGNLIVHNGRSGVQIEGRTVDQVIGGTEAGAGNTIAYNGTGVNVDQWAGFPSDTHPARNQIVGNSIFSNQGLGIDLSGGGGGDPDGVTLNDPQDGDTGSNGFQNFPVLTAAYSAATTRVRGGLNSTPNRTFVLDFYANAAANPSGYGEGQRWLGSATVTTDASGDATFDAVLPGASSGGEFISATATGADGTSEFSRVVPSVTPPSSSLSGLVFADFNGDALVDFGEPGIAGVLISLDGTDDLGSPVHLSQSTDADGTYVFLNLRPGTYTITETQPAGYTQGKNSVGTGGGTVSGDQFTGIVLTAGEDAMNYNYGEVPAATGAVHSGLAAGIGFWNNKNGQNLIKALNGGAGHQLGDWLAATFPHMFGVVAGSDDLAGQSNAYVASFFQSRFVVHGQKLDAQVLATALAVYVTDPTLDSTGVGTQYGFILGGTGLATSTYNVGSNGAAFGVANNTTMTVLDILQAADAQAVNGILYNGDPTKRNQANTVFSAINEAGSI
jgi:hypothetical protein